MTSNILLGRLHFQPVGDIFSHPVCCYNCGKEDLPHQWLMASIFPFKESNTDLIFIVCSEQCRDCLLFNEQLDIQIMLDIIQAAIKHNKTLSPDFQEILVLISK